MIAQEQKAHWQENGWVAFEGLLAEEEQAGLSAWVEEVAREPSGGEQRLHYYEATDQGPSLCRTERFLEDHDQLSKLITGPKLTGIAATLLDEASVLYKEKINYKTPGGAGFSAHQDASAYAFVRHHVTCLIAVDPMTVENGCLEFADGRADRLLEVDGSGCIRRDIARSLDWRAVPLAAGGALFFSSLAPHRSGPNRSDRPRRAVYLTYNARAEGDLRAAYYADRDRTLEATRDGEALRISTIGHFQGTPAEPEPVG